MLDFCIYLASTMICVGMSMCAFRIVTGPDISDRIVALDTLAINAIGLLILIGIQYQSTLYFEGGVLIALLGFVTTSALAKFLLRGDIIE